ncbi:MAG: putative transrane efflux protein, partial [Acidimicrobiaceae bacterium]|nr:putative transrane efflux protein [Acidimicrobiaceae bacterium]
LPLAALTIVITARHVPESRDPSAGRVDLVGAAAVTAALTGLTFGLIEGPALGWSSPGVAGGLVAGTIFFALFLLIESRRSSPLLPLGVFASTQFLAANAATFVVYAALSGALFLLPIVLENVLGNSPLVAGAALLPVTLIMLALSARSGALAARIGPRLQMTVGPLVIGIGLALMVRIRPGGNYFDEVLPAVCVLGLGLAINVAPLTSTALAAAPAEHAGIASAVNNDVARAGGLIAVAVLPVAAGITGNSYLHPFALARGFHLAVLMAAAFCLLGSLVAALGIRNPARVVRSPDQVAQ